MGGLLLVMAGLLALSPVDAGAGVRGLSLAAAGKRWPCGGRPVACGVAASATAYSLAGTAQYASADRLGDSGAARRGQRPPVPYTPVCASSGFRVCIHPAFAAYLPAVTAALDRPRPRSPGCPAPRSGPSWWSTSVAARPRRDDLGLRRIRDGRASASWSAASG